MIRPERRVGLPRQLYSRSQRTCAGREEDAERVPSGTGPIRRPDRGYSIEGGGNQRRTMRSWVLVRYGSCLVYHVNTHNITSNRRTMALLFSSVSSLAKCVFCFKSQY